MTPYYQDEAVTIYHGDCRDVLPLVGPTELVVADPPYGISYESNWSTGRGSQPITNDGTRISLALYRAVIPMLKCEHVLWFTRWDAWPDVWGILASRVPLRGLLVWDKEDHGMGDLRHWAPSYELIASAGRGETLPPRESSIIRYRRLPAQGRLHPVEKPVGLYRKLVSKFLYRSILDPFMGAGGSVVAAKAEGRRAIGIEIEERYCEIAAKRLAQEVLAL